MRAAAHDPKFAKKMGIPQKVAREFEDADERRGVGLSAANPARRKGKR